MTIYEYLYKKTRKMVCEKDGILLDELEAEGKREAEDQRQEMLKAREIE